MTLLISVHALVGVICIYSFTRPLLNFPGGRNDTIEGLNKIRTLINGCSDDLTQIHTPGPIEYLEEEENMWKVYFFIVIVWIWLIGICAYGLWNGIISHILFIVEQEQCFTKKAKKT